MQLICAAQDGGHEIPESETLKECRKRAHELRCKEAAPHAFDDPTFMGGKLTSTDSRKVAVTITNGRCRRRKGKVIGGGHGFYVVELRDQTTLLKTESQLVATTTEIPAPVKQSKIVEDTSEGRKQRKSRLLSKEGPCCRSSFERKHHRCGRSENQ